MRLFSGGEGGSSGRGEREGALWKGAKRKSTGKRESPKNRERDCMGNLAGHNADFVRESREKDSIRKGDLAINGRSPRK